MSKLAYITAHTPFGRGETFVLSEVIALKELGVDMIIAPRDFSNRSYHERARSLLNDTLSVPLINIEIVKALLNYIFTRPINFLKLINDLIFKSKNVKILLKNLIILPKGVFLSEIFKKQSVSHIHAHWASTTSTMAYIISKIAGIPWSFTAHRWDIAENNLLKEKCETAFFVRAISEKGKRNIIEIIKDKSLAEKILVIHMGVPVPELDINAIIMSNTFTLMCPANLVHVKGHKYLFEACKILSDKGIKFKCLIAGNGPLKEELKKSVRNLDLKEHIDFLGRLPHEKLLDLYASREINSVVLPSISTEEGEMEGVPVALMEAMSYGIPVISTNSGGIPELIGDGSGIMIEEKNPASIAEAIEKLITDPTYYNSFSKRGREKIEREYNERLISKKLISMYVEG